MKLLDRIKQMVAVLSVLARVNHAYGRVTQLARRCNLSDDKLRRLFEEFALDFGDLVESETVYWAKVVQDAGIKLPK